MVILLGGLFFAHTEAEGGMDHSAAKTKGNDAVSLPHPQTGRKTIIHGNQKQVEGRGQPGDESPGKRLGVAFDR